MINLVKPFKEKISNVTPNLKNIIALNVYFNNLNCNFFFFNNII